MKCILFCQNPYAFGILEPVMQVLKQKNYEYIWFLTPNLVEKFPFSGEPHTYDIEEIIHFQSDAILCPGNEVPHYLRGVKTQIFHGLAGEKKGHFKIRHYFDLYLTQGPYFTRKFNRLRRRHKNFEVMETGWSKLDVYADNREKFQQEKRELLEQHNAEWLVLYAPTFSPSLSSAPFLHEEIEKLAQEKNTLTLIKFHDLMKAEEVSFYKRLASRNPRLIIAEEPNIVKYLLMADLLVSDTSSVVYEFLLLDKPVLSFRSSSENPRWDNSRDYQNLVQKVDRNLTEDPYASERKQIIEEYHPYQDGQSSLRMIEAIESYIGKYGVPERRKLPFLRRRKINRMFRRPKRNRF